MKVFFSVIICKIVTFLCKMFHKNGTVFPGGIVYDYIDKNVLNKIKYPEYVIVVTGSSGKGSTTRLISHILENNGYDVVYNASGSNGILGILTLVLNNCNWRGVFKHKVLLLEVDERHLKLIFKNKQMTHLLVTNITRDQPSRNGYANLVFEDIKEAIGKETQLIINADDPLVNTLKFKYKNVITYGVDKTVDSYDTFKLNAVDFQYCPICHKKLKYDFYHYGHIGNYTCKYCNFKRGKVNYEVSNVDLKKREITINNRKLLLDKDVLFAVYYTVAAYAICNTIGITEENIEKAINIDKIESKRGKEYKIGSRQVIMLETKNENSLSYYQSLKYIKNSNGIKTIILGFENVSRRYKYNDLSWLYDVEFELLNDEQIDKIICIGRFRYDVATRLEYAGIDSNKLILVDKIEDIIDITMKKSKGTIYTMVCFDMTDVLKKQIEGVSSENN